jgi:hypothetical protein
MTHLEQYGILKAILAQRRRDAKEGQDKSIEGTAQQCISIAVGLKSIPLRLSVLSE